MKLVKAGTQRRRKVIRKGHMFLGGKSHDDKTEIEMKSCLAMHTRYGGGNRHGYLECSLKASV